jgi:osmoprotectant transport system permease protein
VGNPWFSWHYVTSNWSTIESAAREHVILTLLSVGIGFAVALPISALARQSPWMRAIVLGTSSALYAVPSLAAIVALYPFFGFSRWTVVLPLAAYSLVILVRNILTGLDGVPVEAIEAATGMGFSTFRTFMRVRLPLAVPTIVAGLRLATVSTIELVVIGGYVGTGGFGEFIIEGFENNFYKAEITTYIIATVLLALIADALLLGAQRLATPWSRRGVA